MDELNLHLEDMGSEMKVMGAASTIYSPASWERCWGKKKKTYSTMVKGLNQVF